MDIIINEELKKLLPPLTSDEYKILEESIVCDGCREPLVLWNNTLIDGHNRYEICTRHKILFDTKKIESNNIEDIKIWIIDNQKGRRNLTDGWKYELAQTRKEILEKQYEEERKQRRVSNIDTQEKLSESGRTRNEIADELGWSTGKVAMADRVWNSPIPEIKDKVKSGELSINEAYKEVRKEDKKQNKIYQTMDFPSDKYQVIYADPPWKYGDKQNTEFLGGAEKHYLTMSIQKLCELPVDKLTQENAVLFLWVTSPLLEECFPVIKSWGFEYKTSFIWDKVKHNMGHYNSVRHELLLVCTKGSCLPDNIKLYDSVQSIEKKKHSEKPHEFYDIIDTLYLGKKIELFARNKRDNWDVWGNEL